MKKVKTPKSQDRCFPTESVRLTVLCVLLFLFFVLALPCFALDCVNPFYMKAKVYLTSQA